MGSYTEEIDFSGKMITLWGQGKTLDPSGATNDKRIFSGDEIGSSLELHDVIIQNAGNPPATTRGGAIYAVNADVKIFTCTFENNQARTEGGAIYLEGSAVVEIHDTIFEANVCTNTFISDGGAINFKNVQDVKIYSSEFKTNLARNGGAVQAQNDILNTNVEIYNSIFESNEALNSGGAISVVGFVASEGATNVMIIHASTFEGNAAGYYGGGILADTGSALEIYNTLFKSNQAGALGGAVRGGSGVNDLVPILLDQCTFLSNVAGAASGAGAYSGSGITFTCHSGSFAASIPASGQNTCEQCPVGMYKEGVNDWTFCVGCATGRYGDPAITQTNSSHCPKCPSGYYGPSVATTDCIACPAGRYGQFEGETSSACTDACPASLVEACNAGTASPMAPIIGFYLADVATKEQKPCPEGKFKTMLGFAECLSCPIGKFTAGNASSFCFECPAGYHQPVNTSSGCTGCDGLSDRYQDQFGSAGCKSCSALACAAIRDGCGGASPGYCVDCIPGKFVVDGGCSECDAGFFQPSTNQHNCDQCNAGTYQSQVGQGYCTGCQPGSVTDTGSAAGATTCIACAAGEFSAASNVAACVVCAAGSVASTGSESGASSCTECAVGAFSEAPAASACTECAAGASSCTEC
jgi:predicted outer membrane repeat protein